MNVLSRWKARVIGTGPLIRFVPERRLAAVVALTALIWLLPGRTGTVAGAAAVTIVALAAVVDLVLLPPLNALTIARTAPPTVGIGDRTEGGYEFRSASRQPLIVRMSDQFPAAVSGGTGTAIVSLPALGSAELPFDVTGMTRGRAELGTIGARVTTRLGLVGARYSYPLADSMLVLPSVSGVRRYRLLALQHRLDTIGVRTLQRKGEGRGFAGLREYAHGDDPRHIDWKATARRRKLITREYTIERSQTVFTLIDAGRGMTQLAGEYSRFEHALSSALVLTDIAASAGDRVGTLVFDDAIRAFVPATRSRGSLQAVRDAFVPVVASTTEPDYAAAFRFLAKHQRKRSLLVFYTDVIDVRASQALLAHVARSTARHLVLVVALRNDMIFSAAAPHAGGNIAQLYERASAEELLLTREEALLRMRRAGIVVLDVSPQTMTAGVINRYLALKARGAL